MIAHVGEEPAALPRATVRERHVRQRALKKIGIGAVLTAAWLGLVLVLSGRGYTFWGPGVGLPCVFFLMGLVELVFGRSFGALAQEWEELEGWQRGIYGLIVVVIATCVILAVAGTVVLLLV
jgi:uncharacterized membrane protein YagU involved in acid resistance